MNPEKTGNLIKNARKNKKLTQKELADAIFVTDKAVSKWEKGRGCPDITLLPQLSKILEIDIQSLLKGEMEKSESHGGNMNKIKFYKCSTCGNLIISTKIIETSCCGNKLNELEIQMADAGTDYSDDAKFNPQIAEFDGQYTLHFDHPMTKEDFIAHLVTVQYDRFSIINLFAQQDATVTLPQIRGIKLYIITNKGVVINIPFDYARGK